MRNYLLAIALLATTLSYSQNFKGLSGVTYSDGQWSLCWLDYSIATGEYVAGFALYDKKGVRELYNDIKRISKTRKPLSIGKRVYRVETFTNAIAIYNARRDAIIVSRGMQLELLIRDIKRSITAM